jgi:aspartate kinase
MSRDPIVIKLGGDALASPERIAQAARRVARRRSEGPVVAVVSARRGVTDHLLGLVGEVQAAVGGSGRAAAEADRAVATGEVVAAALLAVALRRLNVNAISLDAREAGLRGGGRPGRAHIRSVSPARIARLLEDDVVPVVTGFQGWKRNRVVTLGRGGTDLTAVAIGVALKARRVELVKEVPGLLTADPKSVAEARAIPEAGHGFLSALAGAGSRVIQAEAAHLAERHGLTLEFHALDSEYPLTTIRPEGPTRPVRAVATALQGEDVGLVTALASHPLEDPARVADELKAALAEAGIPVLDTLPAANGLRFAVPAPLLSLAARALHSRFVDHAATAGGQVRRAS